MVDLELSDGAFLKISPEAMAARSRGIPVMPDLEARRLHRLTQWPYKAWCTWCVMGRGKEEPHRRITGESTLSVVGLDYCFLALRDHDPLTVLVTTEIYSGAVEAVLVDAKGVADFPVRCVVQAMEAWDRQRAGIFSDQEAAVMALAAAVKVACKGRNVIT